MQSNEDAPVLFDSWGFVTPETLKACKERTKKWKPALLEFAVQVNEVMKRYPAPNPQTKLRPLWYLTDGTLLGAYRSGEVIEHDYDFDYALSFVTEDGRVAGLEQSGRELEKVGKHLVDSLDKKYTVSVVVEDEYTFKIELWQESSGVHWNKKGQRWYNVHMDLQLMYSTGQEKLKIAYFRNHLNDYVDIDLTDVLPLSEIMLESMMWPCPKNSKEYLTAVYGYLGSPAKYNPETRKYEPM